MNRTRANARVDLLAALTLLISFISGLGAGFLLPGGGYRGGSGASGAAFLGLARHTWLELHQVSSLLLICLILIHLALHRAFLARMLGYAFGHEGDE